MELSTVVTPNCVAASRFGVGRSHLAMFLQRPGAGHCVLELLDCFHAGRVLKRSFASSSTSFDAETLCAMRCILSSSCS